MIRRADASEAGALARLIADSFAHLPVSAWLVDDETERRVAMAGQFEILVAHAIEHGDVDVVDADDAPKAVAAWFPANAIPDIADYDGRLAVACGVHTPRFVVLDAAMHAHHPEAPAHAYLAFLSVVPDARGRGLGSALLDVHHARLDAEGTPAYLEASNVRSRGLYLRHGYADYAGQYGPGEDFDPRNGFWPMWRPSQSRR
jgi:GNAT superfamily N-acetyltransferase